MRRMGRSWLAVAAVLMVACDATTTDPPDAGAEIRVAPLVLEARGDTARLVAEVGGAVAAARWESLDPEVVTVTDAGVARAVAPGTAAVRATIGAAQGSGTVTVLPPVDIRLSELSEVTDPTGKQGVRMRIRNLGGRGYYRLELWKLDPDGRKRRIVHYAEEMAVEPGLDIEHRSFLGDELADWAVAYAREPLAGEPVRTSCVRMDGAEGSCPSDLPDPPAAVDSVMISPAAALFEVGDTVQYVARVFAGGGEVTDRGVVWSTPSPDVISLSETGLAVGLKAGYGQVNATVEGVTVGVGLTVTSPDPGEPTSAVAHVMVAPGLMRLWVGQPHRATAATYDAVFRPLAGRAVTWSVEDGGIATVDASGLVAGAGHGRTRVVATSEGVDGYAVVESYARPVDGAELRFSGMLSAAVGPGTVDPVIDTTWVDGDGVAHDAWIQVGPGSLSMDWGDQGGGYTQHLVLTTYVSDAAGVRKVAETEYVDSGTLEWWYDWGTGVQGFDFTSAIRDGPTYRATWTLPGELAVVQRVGTAAERPYYFRIPL